MELHIGLLARLHVAADGPLVIRFIGGNQWKMDSSSGSNAAANQPEALSTQG